MESIYLLILFIVPGMLSRGFTESFNKERHRYENIYDYLLPVVIDSVVINGILLLIFQIDSYSQLKECLAHFENLYLYAFSAILISGIWSILENTLMFKAYLRIKNLLLKNNGDTHSLHSTEWDDMLNEEDIKKTWQVMSIYKDDKYITSGMRHSSSSTNGKEFEIRVDRVKATERMMKEHPELFKIKYEYYNANTGLRVIMYDQKLLEEHWENKN